MMPEHMGSPGLLADRIALVAQEKARPIVVAIDGRSGAGKSTLAAALAQTLDAALVEGDDFYAGGTGLRNDSPASRASACIDWSAQRTVLEALLTGEEARWHPFDWDVFDGSLCASIKQLRPRPVIIMEGTYSARPELAELVDLRVLVSTPDPERHARLIAREGSLGPWERQWHEAEEQYFGTVMPADRFDIVMPG
ncbi:MAG: (d)CMP kinase [Hyphomonas sp.]|jgi:uridine kinase|nr:(d)CMP kinase [Hyphomonas sp.]